MNKVILLFGLIYCFSGYTQSLRLSEVMFNPDTLEYYCEFIELYNSGNTNIRLDSIALKINGVTDPLRCITSQNILRPGKFAVILDKGYVDHHLHIYSIDTSSVPVLLTVDNSFGKNGLPNTLNTKIILYFNNTPLDSMEYTVDNQEGFSEEKIILEGPSDISNWGNSIIFRGTPGLKNSISPGEKDVAVIDFWQDSSSSINCVLKNTGISPWKDSIRVQCSFLETDSFIKLEEQAFYVTFNPNEEYVCSFPVSKQLSGNFQFKLNIENSDYNLRNNQLVKWLHWPTHPGDLIINEIMTNSSEQGEWIELWNPTNKILSLSQLDLFDSRDTISLPYFIVHPEEYIVLCQEKTTADSLKDINCSSLYLSHWNTLNNDQDQVGIADSLFLIDKMRYHYNVRGIENKNNISLEKINPLYSGEDIWNWGLSVSPQGSTPGMENSLMYKPNHTSNIFQIEPNPFSPDGDGFQDVCYFHCKTSYSLIRLHISVFTLDGNKVHEWNFDQIPGNYTFLWDGSIRTGNKLLIGAYIVLAEITDLIHGKKIKIKKILVSAKK